MVEHDARFGDRQLDQWFTPFWAAEALVDDALRGEGPIPCLEPACGTGSFLAAIPPAFPAFGIDIDPLVIPAARANSGREVLLGDFRTIDLAGREIAAILGNPPFAMATVEGFVDRAHQLLPDGGLLAMILPAFAFQTPSRVVRWMELFSIDVQLIPRTLFPKISQALVWAKYRKAGERRFHGLMLFREQRDVELMRDHIRAALIGPGTWREAVGAALESLGGHAPLPAIYDAITPERRRGRPFWQEKVRQTLQAHFQPIERGRWALKEAA
jgi:adenine-specific DNA-methyltransferase